MNQSQKEYVFRINKVVDYIDANIDKELSLDKLASVAYFSPFHFHRIFYFFVGETLNNFVKRTRMEKSARMLVYDKQKSISEIACECGFNSSSVFCRNFKSYFKTNAQDFRDNFENIFSKNHQKDRKNGEFISSESEYFYQQLLTKNGGLNMKNIEVKKMPSLNLLYCRHVGRFDRIGEAYEKLFRWAGPRGLLNSSNLKTVTVYHDDPEITKIEKLRQSACITVDYPVKTEGEIGSIELPEYTCVVSRCEISVTEFQQAWDSVCLWMANNGYQPAEGNPYELYHNNHEEHPEKKFILDICIPTKPI